MISKNHLKALSSLKQRKFREQAGRFLIEGVRLCEEAFQSEVTLHEFLYCPALANTERANDLIRQAVARGLALSEINAPDARRLTDTREPQGVFAVVEKTPAHPDSLPESTTIVAIERASDPGNLGTIMRTADWFGIDTIVLSQGSVEATNPKVLRASMGSYFRLKIFEDIDLKTELPKIRNAGFEILGFDANGENDLYRTEIAAKSMVLFGNETAGLSDELRQGLDKRVRINQKGGGESLNLSVSVGIVLAELTKKRA